MYKILVLVNEKLNTKPSFDKTVSYFKAKGIDVSFDFQSVDIPISVMFYKSVQGFDKITGQPALVNYLGTSSIVKNTCLSLVKPNAYQAVILSYNMDTIPIPTNSVITSWCEALPLIQGTEFIQLAINQYFIDMDKVWKAITHEIMHSFCVTLNRKGVPVLDEMDITVLPSGERIPAYKNDDPNAIDGNYAQTLANIGSNLPKIYPLLTYVNPYKWFSEVEVAKWKLKVTLWQALDRMREIAQTPFIITSGYRNSIENLNAGGKPNSAHLRGLAVDLLCTDNLKRTKIVNGILSSGIPVFLEIAGSHIHLDLDSSIHLMDSTIVQPDDQ